jgi:hypothetical protein
LASIFPEMANVLVDEASRSDRVLSKHHGKAEFAFLETEYLDNYKKESKSVSYPNPVR